MKKWTDEIDRFILDRLPCKESCDKTMLLLELNERFGTHFTRYAFTTHLVDKGISCGLHNWNTRKNKTTPNFNQRPVGSERKKKGFWQIKVADPNKWQQKNVWAYEQAHNCKVEKGHCVVFLNQDKNDFSPENLYLLTHAELGCVNRWFRGLSTDREESMYRILQVKVKIARHKRAREMGLENTSGCIIEDARAQYLKSKEDPEWRRKRAEYAKEHMKEKRKNPKFKAEYNRNQNIYRMKKRLAEGKTVLESTRRKYGL